MWKGFTIVDLNASAWSSAAAACAVVIPAPRIVASSALTSGRSKLLFTLETQAPKLGGVARPCASDPPFEGSAQ